MQKSLAIFLPSVGALSESFLRRHVQELCPGRVVVVAERELGHWEANCPKLILDQLPGAYRRLRRGVRGRLGLPAGTLSRADARAIQHFLSAHHTRVVLAEYLDYSCRWLRLARSMRLRFFAHAHGVDVSARLRDAEWRQKYLELNEGEGMITMSEVSRQRLIAIGLDAAKLRVIPYGIDVPSQPDERHESGTVRCLAVGRMVAKKGPLLVLKAFQRALAATSGLHLDYVGSGELLEAARQFVGANSLSECVTLHGDQPNSVVHEWMKRADIFVQHSITDPMTGDEEGLPVGILEAMSHALPVVATRHAGIPEAVTDGETGYLVEEGDVESMGTRIAEMVRSPDLRARFGAHGWGRARDRFSWQREKEQLLELLELS
jgi:glycosyltransferase involved in cell wall biosynthesis